LSRPLSSSSKNYETRPLKSGPAVFKQPKKSKVLPTRLKKVTQNKKKVNQAVFLKSLSRRLAYNTEKVTKIKIVVDGHAPLLFHKKVKKLKSQLFHNF
jgi:glycerol-3-phosphate O-acyltransferase